MLWASSYWVRPSTTPDSRMRFVDAVGRRDEALVATEREDGDLDGRECGMELEEDAGLRLALGADGLLFGVGVGEEGHDGAVDAGGGLDDVGV